MPKSRLNDEVIEPMKNWLSAALAVLVLAGQVSAAAPAPVPATAPAPASAGYTAEVVYDISLLGLSIGSARMQLGVKDGRYEIRFFGKPEGLASLFTSNAVNTYGFGRLGAGAVTPGYSWVQQINPKGGRIVEMKFDQGKLASLIATPAYNPSPNDPTEAQKVGTIDPLGGLATMLRPPGIQAGDKACGGNIGIYDGRRVFSFDMWTGGPKRVESGTGGYRGEALYCVATYRRIAGWDAKKLNERVGIKVQVYLAPIGRVAGGGPAFYLPVRMWSDVDVGSVVAVPTQVTINGKPWDVFFAEGG